MVNWILEWLAKLDLYLKLGKCQFEVRRIKFLDVILEDGMVTMDPIKIAGMKDWRTPQNVKETCQVLGFWNFYRWFIKGFSHIEKLLNNLLKKNIKWTWGDAKQEVFDKLKKTICKELVLIQPDQIKPFKVEVDALNYAIGAVLMQRDDKKILHPVAYFSKTINNAQRNYNVYNCELLGLWEMFKHWRAYLHGAAHQVKVHTDHTNLLFWKNPGDHNRRVAQWHSDLMDYDFQLVWKAGVSRSIFQNGKLG